MDVALFFANLKCPPNHILGLCPFADEHEVDAEVVVGDDGVEGMCGLIEELDRFFETGNAVLRAAQKPICPGHVRVEFAEHKGRRVFADDIDAQLETFDRFFAVAFLVIAICDLAVGFCHAEPVAIPTKMVERVLGVIAADWKLGELAVNACQGDVDAAKKLPEFIFLGFFMRFLEHGHSFWLVAHVVIGDGKLGRNFDLRLDTELRQIFLVGERPYSLERLFITSCGLKRE